MNTEPPRITTIIVTFNSRTVLEPCVRSLASAAPKRGVDLVVVDNASSDGCAEFAGSLVGPDHVVRLDHNRGYAAGVNAGLARARGPLVAILNPDTTVPPGSLDQLADLLEAHPRAAIVAPRVIDEHGHPELSVGRFPSLRGELTHALYLEMLLGLPGRYVRFPDRTGLVDWASGCAWLLRVAAAREVGPLDEEYFMYYEDSDYCRQLKNAGWEVYATPEVHVTHLLGRGSERTGTLPADGGIGVLRYFRKFHPEVDERRLKGVVGFGWRLRKASHDLRAALGSSRSAGWARRFGLSLDLLARS